MSSTVDAINFASRQVYLYGYICIISTGLFTTEVSNLIQIVFVFVPSVVGFINGKNGTETYLWWCKLMNYLSDACYALSVITFRVAQQLLLSSMKVAKISISITFFICFLLTIPDAIYWEIDTSFDEPTCIALSNVYYKYLAYFLAPVIYTIGPLIVLLVFGILTYGNIKGARMATVAFTASNIDNVANNGGNVHVNIHSRQKQNKINNSIPRINGQFSTMLIIQILYFMFTTVPVCINYIYTTATNQYEKDDLSMAIQTLVSSIFWIISCTPFSSSFYIYYLLSSAYRQNVKLMLCKKRHIRIGSTNNM
ncbi:hypothetical protein I4U23_022887 [Adineta vaga]|nr:hypothetical protein I4U23_022887 [Adineta vaga]